MHRVSLRSLPKYPNAPGVSLWDESILLPPFLSCKRACQHFIVAAVTYMLMKPHGAGGWGVRIQNRVINIFNHHVVGEYINYLVADYGKWARNRFHARAAGKCFGRSSNGSWGSSLRMAKYASESSKRDVFVLPSYASINDVYRFARSSR